LPLLKAVREPARRHFKLRTTTDHSNLSSFQWSDETEQCRISLLKITRTRRRRSVCPAGEARLLFGSQTLLALDHRRWARTLTLMSASLARASARGQVRGRCRQERHRGETAYRTAHLSSEIDASHRKIVQLHGEKRPSLRLRVTLWLFLRLNP
jgi:hypothetical protein